MFASRHSHLAIGDLLDILPDAAIIVDVFGNISFVNPALRTLLGYAPLEIVGQPLARLVPTDARDTHEESVRRYRSEGTPRLMGTRPVLHAVHRSGKLVPVSISLCNLTLEDGERVTVAVIHDVSTMHTDLDRATAQAETDPVTGVGNRLRLSRRLQALLAGPSPFSMMLLEVVDFEGFVQVHGRDAGEEALRIASRRLQAQVRSADVLVRLASDEFALLFDGLYNPQHLRLRAEAVAQSMNQRMHISEFTDTLRVTIGAAMSPRHGRTEQALLDAAALAMSRARSEGMPFLIAD